MELTRVHGQNVVIYEVVSVGQRTSLIRAYLPHSNLEYLPDLEESLVRFRYQDPIVMRDLNTNIGQAHNT